MLKRFFNCSLNPSEKLLQIFEMLRLNSFISVSLCVFPVLRLEYLTYFLRSYFMGELFALYKDVRCVVQSSHIVS